MQNTDAVLVSKEHKELDISELAENLCKCKAVKDAAQIRV